MTGRDLVGPLQAAILRADSTWVSQPSHLRRRLEEELGADARGHRAQIHQLVVAAEERIPIRLKRNGWSPEERGDLSHLLVVTRGWTAEASDWAVVTWAAALGLTDERPAVRSPAAASRAKRSPAVQPMPDEAPRSGGTTGATDIPSDYFAKATEMPSELWVGATELPSDDPVADELPERERSMPTPAPAQHPVGPPDSAKPAHLTASVDLPKRGTRGVIRKATKLLGHPLDVAYLVKAGPSPALLLLALPIGLAAFVIPALSGVLLMAFMLIMVFGSALWPARILAIQGANVWLLSKRKGLSMKPKAVIAQGTRNEITFAGGRPFPSVRFADQRLWFEFPITGVARRLPLPKVNESRQ